MKLSKLAPLAFIFVATSSLAAPPALTTSSFTKFDLMSFEQCQQSTKEIMDKMNLEDAL